MQTNHATKPLSIEPLPVMKFCKPPCDGDIPCIRMCKDCPQYQMEQFKPEILGDSRNCSEKLTDNVMKTLFGIFVS